MSSSCIKFSLLSCPHHDLLTQQLIFLFSNTSSLQAFCETLEESNYRLQKELLEKQKEIASLKKRLEEREQTILLLEKHIKWVDMHSTYISTIRLGLYYIALLAAAMDCSILHLACSDWMTSWSIEMPASGHVSMIFQFLKKNTICTWGGTIHW